MERQRRGTEEERKKKGKGKENEKERKRTGKGKEKDRKRKGRKRSWSGQGLGLFRGRFREFLRFGLVMDHRKKPHFKKPPKGKRQQNWNRKAERKDDIAIKNKRRIMQGAKDEAGGLPRNASGFVSQEKCNMYVFRPSTFN